MKINKEELHGLFQGIYRREIDKFNRLYEKYNHLVYGVAFSLLKNSDNSQDIVQLVFEKIWKLPNEQLPMDKEASWLYTVTKNTTLNYLRKEKETVPLEDAYNIVEENNTIDTWLDHHSYHQMIEKLEGVDKDIVSLKIIAKMSFKEISQILDMPIGTVQWKYYKNLHTLKILLMNLSIFIVSIGLFVHRKLFYFQDQASNQIEQNIMQQESNQESQIIQNGMTIDSTTTNETIEKSTIPFKIDSVDLGILSIATVFLLGTITFGVILARRQQKRKS